MGVLCSVIPIPHPVYFSGLVDARVRATLSYFSDLQERIPRSEATLIAATVVTACNAVYGAANVEAQVIASLLLLCTP